MMIALIPSLLRLRSPRMLGAVGLIALACAGCGTGGGDDPPERIVLIVIDTLRQDHLSTYGGAVPTPNIDALAESGQRITTLVSSFNQTTMSMASLFTGLTPSLETGDPRSPLPWNGRTWCGMARFGTSLEPGEPCVPAILPLLGETMAGAGYETLGAVSNQFLFRPAGFDRGFDGWREIGTLRRTPGAMSQQERRQWFRERRGELVNEAVAELLDARSSDRFFLYAHYMDAHDHGGVGSYPRGVEQADAAVGELLALLSARDLLEGATVVLTSDHGERLREKHPVPGRPIHHGDPAFDYLVRVPLIVSPPAFDLPGGTIRSDDLHRLLAHLAGVDEVQGPDLAEGELLLTERKWQTFREGRWKSMWERVGEERVLLFDLEADPWETTDVSEFHPEILERHRQRIDEAAARLATGGRRDSAMTEEDLQRLRVLGYVDD